MSDSREELREIDARAPTSAQIEELDRRLADYEQNPEEGIPWEDVRDRVRKPRSI